MQQKTLAANLPSVSALAYLGDAMHSLCIRKMLLERGISKSGELNEASLEYVTAEKQAEAFVRVESSLTEEEYAVFKRAFNSTHLNKPRHVSHKDYRTATGFEAVFGMLAWQKKDRRIDELMQLAYGAD